MFHPRILSCLLLLASGCSTISIATSADDPAFKPGDAAPISSKVSLVHLGSIDSFTITEQGTLAGRLLLNALENKDKTEAAKAKVVYHAIVPKEHYGGEYTALEWFCDYLSRTDDDRRTQLADRFHRSFFDFFAENDYANLKEYLGRKYKLKKFADSGTDDGKDRLSFLEDFILFNNPRREEWERTSKIIECLKIQPGTTIADVGSGPGYYSFKFCRAHGTIRESVRNRHRAKPSRLRAKPLPKIWHFEY